VGTVHWLAAQHGVLCTHGVDAEDAVTARPGSTNAMAAAGDPQRRGPRLQSGCSWCWERLIMQVVFCYYSSNLARLPDSVSVIIVREPMKVTVGAEGTCHAVHSMLAPWRIGVRHKRPTSVQALPEHHVQAVPGQCHPQNTQCCWPAQVTRTDSRHTFQCLTSQLM
jgi:hypothetical protein